MRARLAIPLASTVLAALAGCGSTEEPSVPAEGASDRRPAQRCPSDWPGPWTACSEAAWVERIAERAGFRIVDETGSALVARGGGWWSFYVWTTELREPVARLVEREGWKPLGRRGVLVYGDPDQWRWWIAQGFVFWVQAGPFEDSAVPDLNGLVPLIGASRAIPPP